MDSDPFAKVLHSAEMLPSLIAVVNMLVELAKANDRAQLLRFCVSCMAHLTEYTHLTKMPVVLSALDHGKDATLKFDRTRLCQP